ncbi:hypothetical protein T484DRAFT_1810573, partial [Baffinella frigidus]
VKYAVSLYITFTTLTTVGYGDITQKTTPELILSIIMMALGASTFAKMKPELILSIIMMALGASTFAKTTPELILSIIMMALGVSTFAECTNPNPHIVMIGTLIGKLDIREP